MGLRTPTNLFRRSRNTEGAGRVDLPIRAPLWADSPWSINRRNADLITLRKGARESSLVSLCATVRRALGYNRVKFSAESAEPAQDAIDRTPKNLNVGAMALMLFSPIARVITHSNHAALVRDGVETRSTIEMGISKRSTCAEGLISDRRRSNQVARNN